MSPPPALSIIGLEPPVLFLLKRGTCAHFCNCSTGPQGFGCDPSPSLSRSLSQTAWELSGSPPLSRSRERTRSSAPLCSSFPPHCDSLLADSKQPLTPGRSDPPRGHGTAFGGASRRRQKMDTRAQWPPTRRGGRRGQ